MGEPILMAALLGVGFLAAVAAFVMSPQNRYLVAVSLTVPQLYFGGLPFSLAEVWIVLIGLSSLFDRRVHMWERSLLAPLAGLAALSLAYAVFSPSPNEALATGVRLLIFLILARYAISLGGDDPGFLTRAMRFVAPWLLLQAGLVWLFRIDPGLETRFLRSAVGEVLVGPGASGLFRGVLNNVLDPAKSGGLFVNANTASMFLGVSVFFFAILARRTARRLYYVFALFAWTAVFAAGSKTGWALAVSLPILGWLVIRVSTGAGRVFIPVLLLAATVTAVALPDLLARVLPGYTSDSSLSFGQRARLWDGAWHLFLQNPIVGLGFGGWKAHIGAYVGTNSFPPHNVIIAAWANVGILGAALSVIFILRLVLKHLAVIGRSAEGENRAIITWALCGWAWVFIHGMADNTGLYGESKTMILLALMLGFLVAADRASKTDAVLPAISRGTEINA